MKENPRNTRYAFSMPTEMHKMLKYRCSDEKQTMRNFIVQAIAEKLKSDKVTY